MTSQRIFTTCLFVCCCCFPLFQYHSISANTSIQSYAPSQHCDLMTTDSSTDKCKTFKELRYIQSVDTAKLASHSSSVTQLRLSRCCQLLNKCKSAAPCQLKAQAWTHVDLLFLMRSLTCVKEGLLTRKLPEDTFTCSQRGCGLSLVCYQRLSQKSTVARRCQKGKRLGFLFTVILCAAGAEKEVFTICADISFIVCSMCAVC